MYHFANFQLWGDYRDKVAYKLLANTDASEEMEIIRLQASREAIKNRTEEEELERGRNISKAKKLKGHITSEQVKKRWAEGNWYSEEGKVAMKELGDRNKDRFGRTLVCVETGQQWKSIREATKDLGCSRNTIKNALRTNKVITQGKLKGFSFEYHPTMSSGMSA